MITAQQKIIKLRQLVKTGFKVSRVLIILLLFSFTVNIMTFTELQKTTNANDFENLVISTGTAEKVDNNTFVLLPDND